MGAMECRETNEMARNFLQSETAGPKGWTVWTITGRVDVTTANAAYKTGEEIVQRSEKTVLNMSDIAYISSAGIRVLMRLLDLAEESGKKFALAGAAGTVARVLKGTGMDAVFPMLGSVEDVSE